MTPPDAGKTSTKDSFESELYLNKSRRLLRLEADTSRIKAFWYCTNNIKNATLFYQERKPNFHKKPESC